MKQNKPETGVHMVILLLTLFSGAIIQAITFPKMAGIFPLCISTAGGVLCLVELARFFSKKKRKTMAEDADDKRMYVDDMWQQGLGRIWHIAIRYFIWLTFFYLTIYLVGFIIATVLFMATFLRIEGKSSWLFSLISVMGVLAVILTFGKVMNIHWPVGVVQTYFGLRFRL
jgi:hypothetical protein